MQENQIFNNKILIIDDEPIVVDTIRQSLSREDYNLISSNNGKKGLDLFKRENPALVILDLDMPEIDGFQFLEHIKLAYSDPCSVIVLTGHGRHENVEKCYHYGISAFLRKPFNVYELRGLVKHSISLKHEQQRAEYLASFPQINLNPLLEVDFTGEITFYNKAAINVLKELGVNEDVKLFLPDNIFEILERLEQKKEGQISREVKIRDRIFEEKLHIIPKYNVVRVYTRDITKRKQTEKQLFKLNTAVEQSPSVVVITDVNGYVEYVNPKFSELTGYTADETIGRNLYILKSGVQSKIIYKELWDTISAGNEWRGELHNRKKNGEFYWEFVSISPIRNMENAITHFVKVAEDITRRKQAEDELHKHHHQLEELVDKRAIKLKKAYEQLMHSEKLSAIGKLSASIAHEFNNPIFGIANVLKMVKNEAQMTPEQMELVMLSIRECDRLSRLISKLNDFHLPSSGAKVLTDINKAIDDVIMLMQFKFKSRKIKFQKICVGDLPSIKIVPDQIKQVILNILNNAEQAIPKEGGQIKLEAVFIETYVKIEISDSGAGIKEEDVKSIFEPFFTTKEVKGSGLGLSVSYGIIKEHGGDIKVCSTPGKGTTFTIILPVNT